MGDTVVERLAWDRHGAERDLFEALPADTPQIIELLLDGFGDEQVARRLQVSPRTVQRRVEMLMERMNCTSRFALGYRLGHARVGSGS
jgi:DNA-binding NarL/FixJ family response regulator